MLDKQKQLDLNKHLRLRMEYQRVMQLLQKKKAK